MEYQNLIFSGHAIQQMFRRGIKKEDIDEIIRNGKMIKEYPDDTPYPSVLLLGFVSNKPFHVVAARDKNSESVIVITAYVPDKRLWTDDFRNRRGEL